ncbi:MAG TPA: hypothetical protein DEV93_12915 [Chloroflexi bacterium]|nr:hypothetical protein [Chloroflexota bacterium]
MRSAYRVAKAARRAAARKDPDARKLVKFRQDTQTAIVADARRQGYRPTKRQVKSLRGLLEGIDRGGRTCSSHIEIATRVPTTHASSKTGHVHRKKIGEDLAWWTKAAGGLTRRWKPVMLASGQATGKYVYRVARRVMSALKAAGRLVRRPRRDFDSHLLQRPYRCGGRVVSRLRVAGIQRPQPSFADLLRKYHGGAYADAYLAARKCPVTSRGWRSFATSRLGLVRAWRRLVVALGCSPEQPPW